MIEQYKSQNATTFGVFTTRIILERFLQILKRFFNDSYLKLVKIFENEFKL